ncbi:MAG: hypothetical protein KF816_01665 [Melioribacteraceae bacterium]|nr:hypothetical protein [Melioribacteraceae bacterium]
MKQILSIVIVLLLAKSIYAQDMLIDTTVAAKQDTISISDMVNKQIEIARLKSEFNSHSASVTPKVEEEVVEIVTVKAEPSNKLIELLVNIPIQYILFISFSSLIIFFVIGRRVMLSFKRRTKRALKKKISALREEKVVSVANPKLQTTRKKLKGRIRENSIKSINKIAKELSISKGEVQLAARLKFFEVGKI